MKTKKIILLAFLAIFTFLNCKGEELGRCDLPNGLIPYKKEQVYSFIDGTGQTIEVPVIESKWRWLTSRDETERDYYTYRNQIVELDSEPNNLNIYFRLDANGCMTGKDYNEIGIAVTLLDKSFVVGLYVDAEGNFLTDNSTFFHESIEINGKVYHDVIERIKQFASAFVSVDLIQ